ncbi:MAG: peptidoglycan DD-metalloendopeptidase family protein [Deltaproteobacteria bacterium]|nr:peptidoglycan DD-metalloendopeptidase family protein [Deltaproteobacteria bacterium]
MNPIDDRPVRAFGRALLAALLVASIAGTAAAVGPRRDATSKKSSPKVGSRGAHPPQQASAPKASSRARHVPRAHTLARGETLASVLRDLEVDADDIARIVARISTHWDVRKAQVGSEVSVSVDPKTGDVAGLSVAMDDERRIQVTRAADGFQSRVVKIAEDTIGNDSILAPTSATQPAPAAPVAGRAAVRTGTLSRGETLESELRALGVAPSDTADAVAAIRKKWNPRRAKIGTRVEVVRDDATQALRSVAVQETAKSKRIEVTLAAAPPAPAVAPPPVAVAAALPAVAPDMVVTPVLETSAKAPAPAAAVAAPPTSAAASRSTRVVAGRITSSFYDAAVRGGLPPSKVAAVANLFAWEVDFNTELQRGDSFRVLLSTAKGDPKLAYGTILAAELVNKGETYRAFRIVGDDGHVEYVDDSGEGQRKPFLKSPIPYSRVSSPFARRRFHPVLGVWRPHLGVDFAAPTGTGIRAVGDGVVEFAGWSGGNGRFVKIRHDGVYQSSYSHLSRIPRGIATGTRVKQGQLIGYVGQTGLATGPHLHYAFWRSGQYVDPFKVKPMGGRALTAREKREFLGVRAARLVAMGSTATASEPTAPRVAAASRR